VEKKTITLKDVHELIDEKCVQACQQAWVKKPLAWALYQVWREVDADEEVKSEEGREKRGTEGA
jgi:hypothetical protein